MNQTTKQIKQIKQIKRVIDGIFLLDKPIGFSSNQALQKVKYIFNAKKAGHTGSLDPLASGVLPICFGKATKVAGTLLGADKKYLVTAKFGVSTTTGDAEGEIVAERPVPSLTEAVCTELFAHFLGKIQQVPPMYSAIKRNGVPLYKLARQGITIERESREVEIKALELISLDKHITSNTNSTSNDDILEHNPKAGDKNQVTFTVHCSKGTYVRTLVEDMGEYLQCGAHVTGLCRTQAGPYTIEQTTKLQDLQDMADPVAFLLDNY